MKKLWISTLLLGFQLSASAADLKCATETLSLNQKNGQWFGMTSPATLGSLIAGLPRQFVDERDQKASRRDNGLAWDYSMKQAGESLRIKLSMVSESMSIQLEKTASIKEALQANGVEINLEELGGPISVGQWDSSLWLNSDIEKLTKEIKETDERLKQTKDKEQKKALKLLKKDLEAQLKKKQKEPIDQFETFIIEMKIKCHQL